MRDQAGQGWATPEESARVPTPNTPPTGPMLAPAVMPVTGPPSSIPPPIATEPLATEPGRSRSPLLLIGVLVAVVAGGAFAATQLIGGDDPEDDARTATTGPVADAVTGAVVTTAVSDPTADPEPSTQLTAELADDLVVETVAEPPVTLQPPVTLREVPVDSFEPVDYAGLTEDEILTACYSRRSSSGLATCLRDGIAAGRLDEGILLAEYQFLECRGADLRSGYDFELDGQITNSYQLSDADYTRLASEAAVCFQDKVDQGLIEDYEVPADFVRLECAGGLNPYPQTTEFFEAWLDCVYELN